MCFKAIAVLKIRRCAYTRKLECAFYFKAMECVDSDKDLWSMAAADRRVKVEVGVIIMNAPTALKAQDVAPLCDAFVRRTP